MYKEKISKMSISLQTENENESSPLIRTMSDDYNMFEVTFKMSETGLTVKGHSHILFPKCRNLSSLPADENGNILVSYHIELQYFTKFLNLLYGNQIEFLFPEILIISNFASSLDYPNIAKIRASIIDNVDKLTYSEENDQMSTLIVLLNDESYSRVNILKKCKLSQLKRLKNMTEDTNLLKDIIDAILERYSTDTKSIKKHREKLLSEKIGSYETKIHALNAELTKSNSGNSGLYGLSGLSGNSRATNNIFSDYLKKSGK